ncbi:MAG: type III pantothenate kinase [Deltaproteobacteria bacterium]|nr:type III pantothenate kinase [Deltaproteobacteria bacterium]
MLLVIDIGNTNMLVGVYEGKKLTHHWRLETKKERTADELGIFFKELFQFAELDLKAVEEIIISNVVPPMEFSLQRMCERYFKKKAVFVDASMSSPIKIGLQNPEQIGADRIVNAVAGVHFYGAPLIIVDFGTATTFDYINKNKVYRGGCITPGIAVSNEALVQKASKLPQVEIKKPKRVIGRETIESMQSGIFYGYIGMVDAIVKKIQEEAKVKCPVIATGGFLSLITQSSKTIQKADPFLTLEGLRLMAVSLKNRRKLHPPTRRGRS